MSRKPDAPPSDDDARHQEQSKDATSKGHEPPKRFVVLDLSARPTLETYAQWTAHVEQIGAQANAYSESILLAALRYNADTDTPAPIPAPLHPDVTLDDMRNVNSLLCNIITALRDGDRKSLDKLQYAVEGISKAIGNIPQGKEERYVYFMHFVGKNAGTYYCMEPDNLNRPDWFKHWPNAPWLLRCDPAFAKLDPAYVEKCCNEIVWGGNNRETNTWKRAAAKIAVSVGAFDSRTMGDDDDARVEALLKKRLATAWSENGQKRFEDPEQYVRKTQARK